MHPTVPFALSCVALALSSSALAQPKTPFLLRTSSGDEDGDRYGACVVRVPDLDGDGTPDLLVGAPGASHPGGFRTGAVFVRSGASGKLLRRDEGAFFGDEFGATITTAFTDLDGDGVIDYAVGAPGRGVVRVISGKKGATIETIVPPLPPSARFGAAIGRLAQPHGGASGGFAIGAPLDDAAGEDAGSVWLWQDGALLGVVQGPAAGARFGAAIAPHLSLPTGDRLVVGAPGVAVDGRAFGLDTDTHSLGATLAPPASATPSAFGSHAGRLSDQLTWVGAPGHDGGRGRVDVFDSIDLGAPPITFDGSAADAGFGAAAAMTRSDWWLRLAVGAPGTNDGAGAVSVFAWEDGTPGVEEFRIEASAAGGSFGAALAAAPLDLHQGDELAVGAPNEGPGTVRIYRLAEATPGPAAELGDLLAASLGAAGSADVDVATFEATKGTKLKLWLGRAGDETAKKLATLVRLRDPDGKVRKSWTVGVKAKPRLKRTKLKESGTWTLELSAKKGAGGDLLVQLGPAPAIDESKSVDAPTTEPVELAFLAAAGAVIEIDAETDGSAAAVTLLQPDGSPYPGLASFETFAQVYSQVPIVQTGKHRLVVAPSAPATIDAHVFTHGPPADGVVEID